MCSGHRLLEHTCRAPFGRAPLSAQEVSAAPLLQGPPLTHPRRTGRSRSDHEIVSDHDTTSLYDPMDACPQRGSESPEPHTLEGGELNTSQLYLGRAVTPVLVTATLTL